MNTRTRAGRKTSTVCTTKWIPLSLFNIANNYEMFLESASVDLNGS